MATYKVKSAQRVEYDSRSQQIDVRSGLLGRDAIAALNEAVALGLVDAEPAGPGWGSHNTLLRVHEGALGYESIEGIYGDYLATVGAE